MPMSSSPSGPANSAAAGSQSRTDGVEFRRSRLDVRRVRHDHVEAQVGRHRVEPRALADPNVAALAAEAGEVRPGDVERVGAGVGDPHGRAVDREFGREREPDHPRTRAEVDHGPRRGSNVRALSIADAGDEFGLGTRDQHAAVDRHLDVPERPLPEHVLQGLAGGEPGRASRRGGRSSARSPARRASP